MRIDAPRVRKLTFQAGASKTESAFTGSFTGSFEGTGTFPGLEVEFENIQNTPTLISGSGQIDGANITNNTISFTNGAGLASIADGTLGGSTTLAVDGILEDLDTLGAAGSDGQFIVATGAGTFAYESGATARTSLGLGTSGTPTFDSLTVSNNVTVQGDLTVSGTQTSLDTATLNVADLNILVASGAADSAAADGAGLTVDGASAELTYASTGDKWVFNKVVDVPTSGILINGTAVTATATELNQLDDNTVGGTSAGDIVTIDGSQTLSNKTIAASQVTEISGLTDAEGAQLENIGTTTISAAQWGYLGGLTATDTELNQLDGNTVGGTTAGDIVTIDGSQTLSNKTIAASQVTEISNLTADEGAQLENIGTTTISATQWGYLGASNQGITTTSDVQFDSFGVGTAASGTTGEIRATGDITAFYSSDERLKENITELSGVFNKLLQVGTYNYDWKDGISEITSKTGNDIGVIAQEVKEIFPELVEERDNGYLAVDYVKFTTLLITANREIGARLTSMKTNLQYCTKTIEDLKEEIEKLKNA